MFMSSQQGHMIWKIVKVITRALLVGHLKTAPRRMWDSFTGNGVIFLEPMALHTLFHYAEMTVLWDGLHGKS